MSGHLWGFRRFTPQFGQNFGTYSENSSNSGFSLSSESVISSSTRPAHPQSEHQMPSTGFTFVAFEWALPMVMKILLIVLSPLPIALLTHSGFLPHRGN